MMIASPLRRTDSLVSYRNPDAIHEINRILGSGDLAITNSGESGGITFLTIRYLVHNGVPRVLMQIEVPTVCLDTVCRQTGIGYNFNLPVGYSTLTIDYQMLIKCYTGSWIDSMCHLNPMQV